MLKPTELSSTSTGNGCGEPSLCGVSSHNTESIFGESQAPCMLKTSFVDVKKKKVHLSRYKRPSLSSLPSPYFLSGSQKVIDLISVYILYIIELFLVLNIPEIFLAGHYKQ